MQDHITHQLFRKYYNYNKSKTVTVPANVALVVHMGPRVTCTVHVIPKSSGSFDPEAAS